MKYNVGDKVKIIKNTTAHCEDYEIGKTCIITAIGGTVCPYLLDDKFWCSEEEIEAVYKPNEIEAKDKKIKLLENLLEIQKEKEEILKREIESYKEAINF